MNTDYQSSPREVTDTGDSPADAARRSAAEAERCVRQHPESAVWTAFATGLLLGAVAGWVVAEQQEDKWKRELRRLGRRLHLT